VEAGGVLGQARYLEASALRLDPAQAQAVASSVTEGMCSSPAIDALAAAAADAAFAELGGALVVCRSSSAMEDGRAAAFPGVFVSALGIATPAALAGAVATCWRSAFSPAAVGYLLRMGTEPLDFSLALLLQRQVEAPWYGVYVSVDPMTGTPEPLADLSADGPDAVVAGGGATLQARRRAGGWAGVDGVADLALALESVHDSAQRLGERLGAEVDVEFALPAGGAEPVILQCRPLTSVGRAAPAVTPAASPAWLTAPVGSPWSSISRRRTTGSCWPPPAWSPSATPRRSVTSPSCAGSSACRSWRESPVPGPASPAGGWPWTARQVPSKWSPGPRTRRVPRSIAPAPSRR
jgi:hypothetical protein